MDQRAVDIRAVGPGGGEVHGDDQAHPLLDRGGGGGVADGGAAQRAVAVADEVFGVAAVRGGGLVEAAPLSGGGSERVEHQGVLVDPCAAPVGGDAVGGLQVMGPELRRDDTGHRMRAGLRIGQRGGMGGRSAHDAQGGAVGGLAQIEGVVEFPEAGEPTWHIGSEARTRCEQCQHQNPDGGDPFDWKQSCPPRRTPGDCTVKVHYVYVFS